jgi:UPF0716 protein FxsA
MRFVARFFLLVLVLSLAELWLLVEMASRFSLGLTLALCVLTGFLGGAMVRRQGLNTLALISQRVKSGQLPGQEIVSGLILLVTGTLLLTPGFITDTVGFLLLIPPLRLVAAKMLLAFFRQRIVRAGASYAGADNDSFVNWRTTGQSRPRNEDVIIEVDPIEPDQR